MDFFMDFCAEFWWIFPDFEAFPGSFGSFIPPS